MKMVIEIDLDNSAFYNEDEEFIGVKEGLREGLREGELGRIFNMNPFKKIFDKNGNSIGSVKLIGGAEHHIV